MTKSPLLIPVLAIGICSTTALGRPARPASQRSVELITVGAAAAPIEAVPSMPAQTPAFDVNDLSRRVVEFRMARALAEMGAEPALPPSRLPQAANTVTFTSAIAVPPWMRSVTSVPATMAFVPGCGASAYRPTGFLTGTAERRRAAYYGLMSSVACEQGIPVGLFDAMILRESGYDPAAVSSKQAFGFAQLMPGTANALGVNRYDPLQNMRGGARYLRQQLDRFGRVELALAAYNAGPGRVRSGMVPAISETQAYVSSIISQWQRLATATVPPRAEVITAR